MAAIVEEAAGSSLQLKRERVFRDRANALDMYCDTELYRRGIASLVVDVFTR